MGNHLKLEDVNKIDGFTSEKDLNNIIYPILDVLAKAKEYGKNTKVDAVILNGGMTKFYLIKERIKKFFDLEPVTVNDPDLSVAKGAAFYQYCLDKLKINQIEYNLNRISEDRVTVSEEKREHCYS
jgi:molecular chaperone DnaK (HSP70)